METILLIASIGILNIVCFFIGARVGQKVVNKEELKLPNINPIEKVREYEENKKAKREEENFNTMLENIDLYDGTPTGQKELK